MSLPVIRRALEKRLAAMSPALPTAWENDQFKPAPGAPYQRANLLPNTPDNQTMGARLYFERGVFQIALCYPIGAGAGAAEARAQTVRTHFRRGVSLVESGVTVNVTDTPKQAPGFTDGDRYCVPISVPFQAQILVP